jgi:uncharacterized protein YjgD (DUF1641 family)
MARPIPLTLPVRDPRAELLSRLQNAPAEHAEAILAAYEVLQGLQDRGVLDLLRGALGSSDKILEIAVDAAKSPQSTRGIRNLLLVFNMLGAIDPEQFGMLTRAIPPAVKAMAEQSESPGLWKMTSGVLGNNDVRRGLSAFFALLKAFGGNLATPNTEER